VVRIVDGEVTQHEETGKKWVRACRVRALSDCTLEVAPRSLAPVVRAEADAGAAPEVLFLDSAATSRDISLPKQP